MIAGRQCQWTLVVEYTICLTFGLRLRLEVGGARSTLLGGRDDVLPR